MKTFQADVAYISSGGIESLRNRGFEIQDVESNCKNQLFAFSHPNFDNGFDGLYQFIISSDKQVRFIRHKQSKIYYDTMNNFAAISQESYYDNYL